MSIDSTPNLPPSDDGDFSHPAFVSDKVDYDVNAIAKGLYEDSGVEWPDWLDDEQKGIEATIEPTTEPTTEPVVTAPVDTPPSVIAIGDREIPLDDINTLLQFQDFLRSNPDKAATIGKIIRGENVVPSTPEPSPIAPSIPEPSTPQLPDGFDPDDPVHKFMLDQFSRLNETVSSLTNLTQQQVQNMQKQKAQADMDLALSRFRSNHTDFTDDDITHIRQKTAELGIVGALVRQHESNPSEGIVKALEAGMWNVESIRNKLYNSRPTPTVDSTTKSRQSKLSALSGSSGSTTRVEPRPRLDSDSAMKDAIAKAVEPLFAGQ